MKTLLSKIRSRLFQFAEEYPTLTKPVIYVFVLIFSAIPTVRCGQRGRILGKFASLIGRRVYCQTTLCNGMQIIVVRGHIVGERICRDGCYEPDTVRLLSEILQPNMVFFDIGAHVGQYTLIASKLVNSAGCVHCFEPDPDTYNCLCNNIRLNSLANVTARKLAISDSNGIKNFYVRPPSRMGSNSLNEPDNIKVMALQVECTTLEHYLEAAGLDKIDVIKMDIEGAELDVLKSSKNILQGHNKPVIIVEFNRTAQVQSGHTTNELYDLLRSAGYVIKRIGQDGPVSYDPDDVVPRFFNVLALPPDHRLAVSE